MSDPVWQPAEASSAFHLPWSQSEHLLHIKPTSPSSIHLRNKTKTKPHAPDLGHRACVHWPLLSWARRSPSYPDPVFFLLLAFFRVLYLLPRLPVPRFPLFKPCWPFLILPSEQKCHLFRKAPSDVFLKPSLPLSLYFLPSL